MPETPAGTAEHLPLKPLDLEILLVLAEEELHGYGIMKRVERQSGGRVSLEVGSLYRVIGRLLETGLIAEAPDATAADDDGRRRRFYRVTELGRRVVRAEVERLQQVVETARRRRLATPGRDG